MGILQSIKDKPLYKIQGLFSQMQQTLQWDHLGMNTAILALLTGDCEDCDDHKEENHEEPQEHGSDPAGLLLLWSHDHLLKRESERGPEPLTS